LTFFSKKRIVVFEEIFGAFELLRFCFPVEDALELRDVLRFDDFAFLLECLA